MLFVKQSSFQTFRIKHKIHYADYQYSILCPPWFDMIFYHNDFFEIIPDVIQGFALLQRLFLRVQAKGRLTTSVLFLLPCSRISTTPTST